MATQLTQKRAPAAMQVRSKKSSNGSEIALLLTKLSYARQASIDPNSLDYFSQELSTLNFEDVHAAIEKLCKTRRRDGETAFPDLPTLLDVVSDARIRRLTAAGDWPPGNREFAQREEHRKAHPELYFSIAEIVAELVKRKGMDAQ